MRAPAAAMVAACAACAACGGSPRPAPIAAAPAPRLATRVLEQVPSDTPYVAYLSSGMIDYVAEVAAPMRDLILHKIFDDDHTRSGAFLMRELIPFDQAARTRIGWIDGKSEVVVYGVGLVPVMRAAVDGDALLALVRRAAAASDYKLQEHPWKDRTYVVFPPSDRDGVPVVLMFHPHQVAGAVTNDFAAILPHLYSLTVVPSPITETWRARFGDPAAPASTELMLAFDPAAAAPRLRDRHDLRRMNARTPPACLDALAGWFETLPSLEAGFWRRGAVATMSYSLRLPPGWRAPFAGAPRIPHWLALQRPGWQIGLATPPSGFVPFVRQLVTQIDGVEQVCGGDPLTPFDPGRLGIVGMITALTIASEIEGDQMGMGLVADVRDVAGAWSLLNAIIPLGAMPAPGDSKDFPLPSGDRLHVAVSANAIGLAIGGPFDAARLGQLMRSPPHDGQFAMDLDEASMDRIRNGGPVMFLGNPFDFGANNGDPAYAWYRGMSAVVDGDLAIMRIAVQPP